jgi:excinuclease ABC subunit B
LDYNEANGITPQSVVKPIDMSLIAVAEADYVTPPLGDESGIEFLSVEQRNGLIEELDRHMREAAKAFEFEKAAQYRDRIKLLKAPKPYDQTQAGGGDRIGEVD